MNVQDAVGYRKLKGKVPTDPILAFEKPATINEVVLYDSWRFRIVQEISRDEFMLRMRDHKKYKDCVAAASTVEGARLDITNAKDQAEPDPGMKFFYVAVVV